MALKALTWIYILCVCSCRIYLGRHSFDQVILGFLVGLWLSYFFQNVYLEKMFDAVAYPKETEALQVSVKRAFKAFKISCMLYIACVIKISLIYIYVDYNNVIPQAWIDSVHQTCPVFKKANLFAEFSISHLGFVFTVPAFYFWNW